MIPECVVDRGGLQNAKYTIFCAVRAKEPKFVEVVVGPAFVDHREAHFLIEGEACPGIVALGFAGVAREAAFGVVIPPGFESARGEIPARPLLTKEDS